MRTTLIALILILFCKINVFAQFGTIDSSFGENGKLINTLGKVESPCVAIQKSGRILAGGSFSGYVNGYDYQDEFYLTRFYKNGPVDKTFGNKGSTISNWSGEYYHPHDIALQADGKILMAGAYSWVSGTPTTYNYFTLARYNSNGLFDSAFGYNGRVTSEGGQSFEGIARRVIELPDKRILVGGVCFTRFYDDDGDVSAIIGSLCVAKYNSDGSTDTSFGIDGVAKIGFGENKNISNMCDFTVQQDGKILIAGTLESPVHTPVTSSDLVVVRLNTDGIIDSSFGENGIAITDIDKSLDALSSILLEENGKIIVTANFSHGERLDVRFDSIAVLRYNTNGTIDSSFGKKGTVILAYENKPGNNSTSSMLLPNGKILISGYVYFDNEFSFLLTAINNNGILDSSFGNNGFTITSFKSRDAIYNEIAYAYDMDIDPDGKIVLAGTYKYSIPNSVDFEYMALARYNGETVLPITLSSFTATKKQNSVLLNWQTASENNNNYFSLERSNNNSNFKELVKVNSKGNSSQIQQYSFEDIAPVNGANYYRLKQVNKDGTATTSKTVLVDFSKAAIIKLYPNPVKDIITIEGLTANKTTLSIIDINGKVLAITAATHTTYNWNIKALPAGNYYLKTEADKKINTIKFVKE